MALFGVCGGCRCGGSACVDAIHTLSIDEISVLSIEVSPARVQHKPCAATARLCRIDVCCRLRLNELCRIRGRKRPEAGGQMHNHM